jgi:hypothetical protein
VTIAEVNVWHFLLLLALVALMPVIVPYLCYLSFLVLLRVVLFVHPGLLDWLDRRFSKGPPQCACPSCGYDLCTTPHLCPECGTRLVWGIPAD